MRERRLFLVVVDCLLINAAVALAFGLWSDRGDRDFDVLLTTQGYWFVSLSALWVLFEFLSGLYDLSIVVNLQSTARALIQVFFLQVAGGAAHHRREAAGGYGLFLGRRDVGVHGE